MIPIERTAGGGAADGGDGGGDDDSGSGGNGGAATAAAEAPEPKRQIRIRKLALLGILVFLSLLALVDRVRDDDGRRLQPPVAGGKEPATATPCWSTVAARRSASDREPEAHLLRSEPINPVMKQAVIAIEHRRFYLDDGVDVRGIGRALWQDIRAQAPSRRRDDHAAVRRTRRGPGRPDRLQQLREAALATDHAQVVEKRDSPRTT